jgi:uncharacterized damage-inducible protein DinB
VSRRDILLDSLHATLTDLRRITRPVSEVDAWRRAEPERWSVADVVAHMAQIEPLMRARFVRVVTQERPFEPYLHPDERTHDVSHLLSALVAAFARERQATLAYLTALAPGDWNRRFIHQTDGEQLLRQGVQSLVGHDNDHLEQIATIREFLA